MEFRRKKNKRIKVKMKNNIYNQFQLENKIGKKSKHADQKNKREKNK